MHGGQFKPLSRFSRTWLGVFGLVLVTAWGASRAPVHGQVTGGAEAKLQAKAVLNSDQTRQGGQNVIAVVLDIIPNWHIASDKAQSVKAGFKPFFTTVTAESDAPGLSFGEAQFPKPYNFQVGELPNPIAVFGGQTIVYLPVLVLDDAPLGEKGIEVVVTYQACDDTRCDFPTKAKISTTLQVIAKGSQIAGAKADAALFAGFDPTAAFSGLVSSQGPGTTQGPSLADQSADTVDFYFFAVDASGTTGFALLLILAAVGGALLNFTPCVLPVIPIKVLGLAQTAGNRKRTLALGTVMSAGVVTFWLGLGIAIAGVSGFTASNQLFQYPAFSIGVGVVIAVLAVGMCGLFALRLPRWVYAINPRHDSYAGSFGFGMMTAVLSTPCTAPMMGAAAAWAATQKPASTLATFTAIGLGMALPYFILSANPKLVDRLPKTGPGSELLKQVMGLLMLAAAAFFVGAGVTGMLSDGTQAAPKGQWWVVAGFIAAAGIWLAIRVFKASASPVKRGAFVTLGMITVVASAMGALALTQHSDREGAQIHWVYYTPERFDQALADGQVVLLDFTADWCANCHLLELTVLNSDAVAGKLREPGYVAMKVDLTGGYPDGKQKLNDTGAVMIPWLVIFAPDGQEVFKADWYTASQLTDALTQAKRTTTLHASNQNPRP